MTVFNLNDDGHFGNFAGNCQHLLDLVNGTGLKRNVGEALVTQATQQRHSLFTFRNTGGDHDAVNGGAGSAGTDQGALGT